MSIHYLPETLKEKLRRKLRSLCCFGDKDKTIEFELMEKERRRQSRRVAQSPIGLDQDRMF